MNLLHYKGYTGEVEFDAEANVLFGRVLGTRDVVTFEGDTVAEVEQAFRDSIDEYLTFCAEQGRTPEKPFSGNLPLRTTPDRHRQIALAAAVAGRSINSWLETVATEAAARTLGKETASTVATDPGPWQPPTSSRR